jgi:type IV pilus assembly protein PilC
VSRAGRLLRLAASILGAALAFLPGPDAARAAERGPASEGPILARAYQVRFRPLKDAADLVGSVVSADGSVTLQPKLQTLVVQDHAAVLDRVAALLQSFDLPPRNVEVTMSLFVGTDRREEEAGRQSRAAGLSREVRGVTETLGDVTKWNAYEPLGSRSMIGAEGSTVTADLSGDYRVSFEVESVTEPQGVIKFRRVSLKRVSRGADGAERVDDLVTTSIVIPSGRLLVVGAAKSPDSRTPMPQFYCRIASPTGEIVERVLAGSDEAALRRELEDKDYLVLELRRRSAALQAIVGLLKLRARISSREFLFFNQELSALLRAGLPILTSLDILLERRENPTFRRALADIRERVKAGEMLSEAFAAQGELFPRLYCSSLASGERSGELPTVLKRYIAYSRTLLAIRRKVVSALTYPAILLIASAGLIALMAFYIIPKFSSFMFEFGTELPLVTKVMIGSANFAKDYYLLLVAGILAVVGGILTWQRSGTGRVALDRIKLNLPIVGGVIHDYAQNRFTRTLGTLIAGGIPLVTSLELAARAVGNALFERELTQVAVRVREGQSLWESLERTRLISHIAVEMIKVGESTGSLEEMLENASEFMDEEIDFRLTRVVSLIEPLMLVVMAVVVGSMLLAIYLPLIRTYGQSKMI